MLLSFGGLSGLSFYFHFLSLLSVGGFATVIILSFFCHVPFSVRCHGLETGKASQNDKK